MPARVPKLVLCAGLKSSASTWLYNAVIQILKAQAPGARVAAFYAEDPKAFPPGAERADFAVVKTHIPSPALQALTRFVHGTVFITVREPRDAIASLMQRFGHAFGDSLREVTAGAARIVELSQSDVFVLNYEGRFFDRRTTVGRLAAHLGVKIPAATLARIHDGLTRDKVTKKIAVLERRGAFGRKPDPDRFDPATHWHPGHVGDATTGKHAQILSAAQERAILAALREYSAVFGYRSLRSAGSARARARAKKPCGT